jgi:type II secretory ATPase GspE/PulE/Tfp pilus assembly ATPase PilB-like protein
VSQSAEPGRPPGAALPEEGTRIIKREPSWLAAVIERIRAETAAHGIPPPDAGRLRDGILGGSLFDPSIEGRSAGTGGGDLVELVALGSGLTWVSLDPCGLPPRSQYDFPDLPVYIIAEHPTGVITLGTHIPFLLESVPKDKLAARYGTTLIRSVLVEYQSLLRWQERMVRAGRLSPAPEGAVEDPELWPRRELAAQRLGELGISADVLSQLAPAISLTPDRLAQAGGPFLDALLRGRVPYFNVEPNHLAEHPVTVFPAALQRRFSVCPISQLGRQLTIAASRELPMQRRNEIANLLGGRYQCTFVLAENERVERSIAVIESKAIVVHDIARQIKVDQSTEHGQIARINTSALKHRTQGAEASAIELVDAIFLHCTQNGATDIHIAEHPDRMAVRYRVDGLLQEYRGVLRRELSKQVMARIKILAGIDTQYSPVPQDGKLTIQVGNQEYDLRVCTTNTIHGECAAIRVQAKGIGFPRLENLGYGQYEIGLLRQSVEMDHGLVIICGPTGAGKSTTLNATIGMIDRKKYHVCTAEQPVEFRMDDVEQTDISPDGPLSFSKYVESVLRMDPDYIMIGETRDTQTASQVLRAAITGHVVLTTLHSGAAVAAPGRLFDLGCDAFLLADALSLVCAQRLIRRICPECSESVERPTAEWAKAHSIPLSWIEGGTNWLAARGCPRCNGSGYRGRFGLMEAMAVDTEMRKLIRSRAPASELMARQIAQGGKTLLQHAIEAAGRGVTSIAEALSVTSGIRE